MITQNLRVQRRHDAHPEVCRGILFLAAPVESWLRELCSWERDLESLSLYLCPSGSFSEQRPSLLVLGSEIPEYVRVPSIPLQNCGERLYYPCGSELLPHLTPEEEAELPGQDLLLVLPRIGVLRYRELDRLDPALLLELPMLRNRSWLPIPNFPVQERRFMGTEWVLSGDPEVLLEKGKGDIGEQELKKLPQSGLDQAREKDRRGGLSLGVAKVLFRVARIFPEKPGVGETWVNRMENWAAKRLRQQAWENQGERDKEIQRLLDMLKENPLEGLRYAIPLSGLNQSRGKAPPGNRLSSRNTNFNLRNLGGGGAADPWHIQYDAQAELIRQYRELARNEEARGEYRRAAYVYGELLGDISEAARALERGKFYIEAGELWLKKLNNPTAAARLFAQGGQIHRAIELYLKQGARIEAVALYRQIGCEKEALVLLGEELEVLIQKEQYLQAADLVEQELKDQPRSLDILEMAWPNSSQALECKLRYLTCIRRTKGQKALQSEWTKLEAEAVGKIQRSRLTAKLLERLYSSMKPQEQDDAYDRMLRIAHPWISERDNHLMDSMLAVSGERRALRKDYTRFRMQKSALVPTQDSKDTEMWEIRQRFSVLPEDAILHAFTSTASKFAAVYLVGNVYRICVGSLSGFSQVLEGSMSKNQIPPTVLFHPSARFLYLFSESSFGPGKETVQFPDRSKILVQEVKNVPRSKKGCVSGNGSYFRLMFEDDDRLFVEEISSPLNANKLIARYPLQIDKEQIEKLDLAILNSVPCVLINDNLYFCEEKLPRKVNMFENGGSFLPIPHPCNNPSLLPLVHLESGYLFGNAGLLKEVGECKQVCVSPKGELLAVDGSDRFIIVAPHQPEVVRVLGQAPVGESFVALWAGMRPRTAGLLTCSGELLVCEY